MTPPPSPLPEAFLGLGANLGNPWATFARALAALERRAGPLTRVSRVVLSPPWDGSDQPEFLNLVAGCHPRVGPRDLLALARELEGEAGRPERRPRWGPRPLDIDIILWGQDSWDEPGLTVPHPHFRERAFVLQPLAEIAPEARDPASGAAAAELWARLLARGVARLEEAPPPPGWAGGWWSRG